MVRTGDSGASDETPLRLRLPLAFEFRPQLAEKVSNYQETLQPRLGG